ncbi:hypothetical protein E4T44_00757 [Aureobasidium sp. EXF-8845]|nr:hypothetical protein E4T44_00757 [Aureobasidium sp. EXF-8845]KAI4857826.1 hypothetical protein E4T45_00666 [Aureobasidium sp. EXF-8846]
MKVHKAILRSHSELLAKICDNRPFQDIAFHYSILPHQEAVSGILNLEPQLYRDNLDNYSNGDDPDRRKCKVIHTALSLVYLAWFHVLAKKRVGGLRAMVIVDLRGSLDRDLEHHKLIKACHIIFKKTVKLSSKETLKTVVAKAIYTNVHIHSGIGTQAQNKLPSSLVRYARMREGPRVLHLQR